MKKFIFILFSLVLLAIATNQTQWVWKDFDDVYGQANYDAFASYEDGTLSIIRTDSANHATAIQSNTFNPVKSQNYSDFGGLLGLSMQLDTVAITAGSADTVWSLRKDTVFFSLEGWYQGEWKTMIDTLQWFKQNDTDSLLSVFPLPAQHGNLWLWRNAPFDTAATNLDWFPSFQYRTTIHFNDKDDSAKFNVKEMWYAY